MYNSKVYIRLIKVAAFLLPYMALIVSNAERLQAQEGPRSECQASFSYTYDSMNFLGIYFIDQSTGSFGSWQWDFGDGWGSSEQNPFHAYTQAGQYHVCLTISAEGKVCYDVECKDVRVPRPSNCQSTFTWAADSANPFFIRFTCHPGEDADDYFWSFGDGDTSSLCNPCHVFADTGVYIVTLISSNRLNPSFCYSVYIDTVHIKIEPCISSFFAHPSLFNPLEVQFIATPSGNIDHYYWDFGDGRTSMEPNPIYIYSDTGIFTVCLTVWNGNYMSYCLDQSCQEVKIRISKCQADFSWLQDTIYPLKFRFINQSYGVLNDFLWDCGDGDTSHQINPFHAFPSPGDYHVKLRVRNFMHPEFCTDSKEKIVATGDLECIADFSWKIDSLKPLGVIFTSLISGSPDYIHWDFGDGTTDSTLHPFHFFPDTGIYRVSLVVRNDFYPEYCADTNVQQVHVYLKHHPKADFTFVFDSLSLTPNLFHFYGQATSYQLQSWLWTFGDGTSSNLQNPVHIFPQVQTFNVCLKITDFLPPKYYLTDKCCKTISTHEYFNLGGSVYDGNLPINNPQPKGDTALVTLYKIYPGQMIIPWRSGTFHNLGYYWFTSLLEGEYLIKAQLTPKSVQANKFFPTWAPQTLLWQSSNPVLLNENIFNANVHLVQRPYFEQGPGSVYGMVIVTSDPLLPTGNPASNICVFLLDDNHQFLDFTLSDSLGRFHFDKLPWGTYVFIPDATGMSYTTDTAIVNAQKPQVDDILLKMWNTDGMSAPPIEDTPLLSIWPNPASDGIKLKIRLTKPCGVNIELISATGQILNSHFWHASPSSNEFYLNLQGFSQGIYLLRVITPLQSHTYKILKR